MMSGQFIATQFSIQTVGQHQRVGVDTVQTLTAPAGASIIMLQAEGGTIRYRFDGGTATSTSGLRLAPTEGERRLDMFQGVRVSVIGEAAGAFCNYVWVKPI
jgi:hypothetical protein